MNSYDWLDFLESEYLAGFIKDGGSAIKFAVPLEDDIAATLSFEIKARARQRGYIVAHVDSGLTRVHMVEQLFFSVADQIPWRETVQRVVGRFAEAQGYAPAAPGDQPLFLRLADANNLVRIPRVFATLFHAISPPDSAGNPPPCSTGFRHPVRTSPAAA